MGMELTRRQRQFLNKLIELHRRDQTPVHYSELAAELGVSKVTAYEMLRRLEKRGLVQAAYQRRDEIRGPGRASVLFSPTLSANGALVSSTHAEEGQVEWDHAKTRLLDTLKAVKTEGYEALLEEILARLPDQLSPMIYLAEAATAIVLGVHTLKEEIEAQGFRRILKSIGLPREGGLSALAGLGAGLTLVDRINRSVAAGLLAQLTRYQALLAELSAENRRRLAQFTQQVLEIVSG